MEQMRLGEQGAAHSMKIINISLAFTGLDVMESGQQGIEDFFKSGTRWCLPCPVGSGHGKHLRLPFHTRQLLQGRRELGNNSAHVPEEIDGSSTRTLTWECPRCRSCLPIIVRPNEVESERVDTIRLEHEDWHFAKDLARENAVVLGGGGVSKSTTRGPRVGKKKRKKESVDIASYFKKN
jgi:DNA polymerase eta